MSDQRARELIDEAVSRNVEVWAKKINLTRSDARFAHFREDVTAALHAGIDRHIMEQDPQIKTYRTADMRKRLKDEADDARDLAAGLRAYHSKYVARQVRLVLRPGRVFDPIAPAEDFEARASFLEEIVGDLRDAGGAPSRLRPFKALAEGLIRAYRHVTGKKGTGVSARSGSLLKLVEAVLPAACKIAEDLTKQPLQIPSYNNLGEQLNEIAHFLGPFLHDDP